MLRVSAKTLAAAVLVVSATGCGAVSGSVSGSRNEAEIVRGLTGAKVYLVPATIENVTELSKGCDASSEWYDRYRGEHQRLGHMWSIYAESAAARASSGEWHRYLNVANIFRDSVARLPHAPPTEPDSLLATMRLRTTTMDAHGHYGFSRIAR
jgi:hypothetical protein